MEEGKFSIDVEGESLIVIPQSIDLTGVPGVHELTVLKVEYMENGQYCKHAIDSSMRVGINILE